MTATDDGNANISISYATTTSPSGGNETVIVVIAQDSISQSTYAITFKKGGN